MAQPSNRSFATIVSLDLHGYSRLTEQDEIGTHRALMTCMRSKLEPIVRDRGGFIVKTTGDGALLYFPKASEAVLAMIRFQREVAAAEERFPESRRLRFRIGIHRAQAIFDKGDVFGHGVNVAVRLQEIAETGSIFLSDVVLRQLNPRTAALFKRLGKRRFKNIEERFDIFSWQVSESRPLFDGRRVGAVIAAVLLLNMVLPTAALNRIDAITSAPDDMRMEFINPRSIEQLPIATLTALPRSGLPRFGLRGTLPDHEIKTTMAAAERSLENRREIAEDAYLQAFALYNRHTPEAFARAIDELDEALRLDAGFERAHALFAAVYWGGLQNRWQLGRGLSRGEMLRRTRHHLARARPSDPFVSMVMSEILTEEGRHQQAIDTAEQAIARDPTQAVSNYAKGRALLFAGRPSQAETPIRDAIRLDPHASRYLFGLALVQFSMDRFDEAERTLARATSRNGDDDWTHLLMAATQGHLGLRTSAQEAIGRFDRLSLVRRGWFASQIPYVHHWPFRDADDRDRLHLGMVLAGIPEVSR